MTVTTRLLWEFLTAADSSCVLISGSRAHQHPSPLFFLLLFNIPCSEGIDVLWSRWLTPNWYEKCSLVIVKSAQLSVLLSAGPALGRRLVPRLPEVPFSLWGSVILFCD